MADIPEYARVQNAVRFIVEEQARGEKNLDFLIVEILFGLFQVPRMEILTVMDYPRKGVYDVTFNSKSFYRKFLETLEKTRNHPKMEGIKLVEHFVDNTKLFTVKMYSPYAKESDIKLFLQEFCVEVEERGKVLNQHQLWTGKWKFLCRLKEDAGAPGRLLLPPARFKIGKDTGDLFFPEMGTFCKNCKQYGHESCGKIICTKCLKEGHVFSECGQSKTCRACKKTGHFFKDCPEKSEAMEVGVKLKRKTKEENIVPEAKKVSGKSKEKLDTGKEMEEESVSEASEGEHTEKLKKIILSEYFSGYLGEVLDQAPKEEKEIFVQDLVKFKIKVNTRLETVRGKIMQSMKPDVRRFMVTYQVSPWLAVPVKEALKSGALQFGEDYGVFCNKALLWKSHPKLGGVEITPHFPTRERLITVRMYSPYITEEEIVLFLSRFCEEVKPKGKIYNQYGLWTTKWKFQVKFQKTPDGKLIYPPGRFKIGPVNGDLFFSGMDDFCRKCKRYGHRKDFCDIVWCYKCQEEGHEPEACKVKKKCHLCGDEGHLAVMCPKKKKKKKEVMKRSREEETDVREEPEEEETPTRKVMEEKKRKENEEEYVSVEYGGSLDVVFKSVSKKEKKAFDEDLGNLKERLGIKVNEARDKVYCSFHADIDRFVETYKVPAWLAIPAKSEMLSGSITCGFLDFLMVFAWRRGMTFG
ncbi:uncharacterized protein LOC130330737 [Hyla sarda]|uniref:uncharacterized protein LOC130330737 n=1 Tax=Hyla sarda TaxID=327740 RepID=UPI0024C3E991|nr:uncharacterized protein LOC130330737 [Hyla sarda]